MTEVIAVDDARAVDVAAAALLAGQAVVLPTDTVYGVGTTPGATQQLYALKGRPESVPIAVLVASLDQAADLVDVPAVGRRLANSFWPGPLTIVMHRVDGDGTLGVRCPDHVFIHVLARRVGPLAVTSANRHGEATPPTAREAAGALAGPVAVVVDGGPCGGIASTVVDVTDPDIAIVRTGPITEEQVRAVALR